MIDEIIRQDRSGNSPVVHSAAVINSGRGDRELDRVKHHIVVLNIRESVPEIVFAEYPRFLMVRQIVDIGIGEFNVFAVDSDFARLPHIEEPVLFRLEFAVEPGDLFAELNGFADDVPHHDFAVVVHHFCGDVQRGDHVVLRRGRTMHHIRFVELNRIDLDRSPVFDVQHGRLRECRQQFVRGLRTEDRRIVRFDFAVRHAVVVLIHRAETRVGIPCFIEVQVFHALFELFLDLDHVVADSVVGGVCECGHLDRSIFEFLRDQLAVCDFLFDRGRREFGKTDGSDGAAFIAARDHVDRERIRDGHGVIQRFVAVAVHKCDVIADQLAAPDDLVDGGCSVQDIVSLVGAEHSCGILFRIAYDAFMVEQRTQLRNGDGEVGAEHVFTEKLEHCDTRRAPEKALSAEMSGRVPCIFVEFGISDQFPEECRIHACHILFCMFFDASREKLRRISGFPETSVDSGEIFCGKLFRFELVGHQQNRDCPVAFAQSCDEFGRVHLFRAVLFRDVPVDNDRSQIGAGKKDFTGVFVGKGWNDLAFL